MPLQLLFLPRAVLSFPTHCVFFPNGMAPLKWEKWFRRSLFCIIHTGNFLWGDQAVSVPGWWEEMHPLYKVSTIFWMVFVPSLECPEIKKARATTKPFLSVLCTRMGQGLSEGKWPNLPSLIFLSLGIVPKNSVLCKYIYSSWLQYCYL